MNTFKRLNRPRCQADYDAVVITSIFTIISVGSEAKLNCTEKKEHSRLCPWILQPCETTVRLCVARRLLTVPQLVSYTRIKTSDSWLSGPKTYVGYDVKSYSYLYKKVLKDYYFMPEAQDTWYSWQLCVKYTTIERTDLHVSDHWLHPLQNSTQILCYMRTQNSNCGVSTSSV